MNASLLLQSNPTHYQKVYKLKVPFLYKITPTFLVNMICSILMILLYPFSLFSSSSSTKDFVLRFWKPFWVERYIILVGDYLYKFQITTTTTTNNNNTNDNTNNTNTTTTSTNTSNNRTIHDKKMKMKGSPIPINASTNILCLQPIPSQNIVIYDDNNNNNKNTISLSYDDNNITIPIHPKCLGYFTITSSSSSSSSSLSSSTTTTSYYATTSQLDTHTWINTLTNTKQEYITKSMGHSKIPVCDKVKYVNRIADNMIRKRDRIRERIRKREMEEVELMYLYGGGGNGGSISRGYFG